MNTEIEKDGFRVEITPQFLSINGVHFSPGEAGKVANVLVWAIRMQDLKALPPTVTDGPFTITFSEDGFHRLSRNDNKSTSFVTFQFSQVDSLVNIVNSGVDAYKNNIDVQSIDRARARGRVGAVGANYPDIIDGKY